MQDALIIEHDEIAVGEFELQLQRGLPQQHRKAPVSRIERRGVARTQIERRDRAAVVVYGSHVAAAGELNQRPLGVQFRVLRTIMKRHRSLRQSREGVGIGGSQMFGEGIAVGEQAVAAVGRSGERVQGLKSGYRFAIGVVGVQAEA